MIKRYLVIIVTILTSLKSFGQDPIYSNYFANPMNLNPAFAGNNHDGRAAMSYRLQWPGSSAFYNTFSLGFDKFFEPTNLAFGLNLLVDDAGKGTIRTNKVSGIVGYRVKVNNNTYIKGGIDLAYTRRTLAWDKLIFYDAIQLSGGLSPGGTTFPSNEIDPNNFNRNLLDIGSGLLLFSDKYYIGIAGDHLNIPPEAFLSDKKQNYIGRPILFSLQAGYQFSLDRLEIENYPSFVTPHFLLASQSGFTQLNFGVNGAWDLVTGGIGYRVSNITGDAVLFNVGLRWDNYRASYNFDFTTSNLTQNLGGAHEINVSYLIKTKNKSKINDCFKLFE
jgi:type IX secretion system PorP/SprF family membrane protein